MDRYPDGSTKLGWASDNRTALQELQQQLQSLDQRLRTLKTNADQVQARLTRHHQQMEDHRRHLDEIRKGLDQVRPASRRDDQVRPGGVVIGLIPDADDLQLN